MSAVREVVCIGGGLIGSGWAARFALAGIDVAVYDPSPAAATAVEDSLTAARRAWNKLGRAPTAHEGEVRVIDDIDALAAALETADWVQESLPEREELKQEVLSQIEVHLADDVVIASSTSGLLPSRLQTALKRPQRFCVAHPFTPVYLLPLVEICGGGQTAADTAERAGTFYQSIGMSPLHLKKEIDGFVADRLMEALWREALWLVNDDIATAGEVDDAIRLGCGIRWAFMGPFLTYRLGGGAGGMRHFMQQFAPALKLPWTKLMDTPEMDDALLDKIVSQSDAQAAGASINELMHWRDDCIVSMLQALSTAGTGALPPQPAASQAEETAEADSPLSIYRRQVPAEWIDYNGHVNEARYLQAASESSDVLLTTFGVDAEYAQGGERGYYTVETHLRHLQAAYLGDTLIVETQLLAADEKRLHMFHTVRSNGVDVATAEQLLLHVVDNRAAPAGEEVLAKVQATLAAHATHPAPEAAGRIAFRR